MVNFRKLVELRHYYSITLGLVVSFVAIYFVQVALIKAANTDDFHGKWLQIEVNDAFHTELAIMPSSCRIKNLGTMSETVTCKVDKALMGFPWRTPEFDKVNIIDCLQGKGIIYHYDLNGNSLYGEVDEANPTPIISRVGSKITNITITTPVDVEFRWFCKWAKYGL